jgi:hypothetical protein
LDGRPWCQRITRIALYIWIPCRTWSASGLRPAALPVEQSIGPHPAPPPQISQHRSDRRVARGLRLAHHLLGLLPAPLPLQQMRQTPPRGDIVGGRGPPEELSCVVPQIASGHRDHRKS